MGDDTGDLVKDNYSRLQEPHASEHSLQSYRLEQRIASGQRNVVRWARNEKLLSLAGLILFVLGLGVWFRVIRLPWL